MTPSTPHPRSPSTSPDGLAPGPAAIRGRGTPLAPPNRFDTLRHETLPEAAAELALQREGEPLRHPLTVVQPDEAKTILNKVDSPDLPFKWTLNPYRGCEHGCVYCYARPGHEYLSLSCGLDFETKLFAKHDAPQLLRKALAKESWEGEPIVLSGVTDPYQPIEEELRITRACLEVCLELRQPVCVITKSRRVTRDLDVLSELAKLNLVHVVISVTTLDHSLASIMEPRASSPASRVDAIHKLAQAGVPTMVMVAPVIPAINDHEVPAILKRCRVAGARAAGTVLLRLPHQLKELFLQWLRTHFPDRAAKVESQIRDTRDGELYTSGWFERGRGSGALADQLRSTFEVFARRNGLDKRLPPLNRTLFALRKGESVLPSPPAAASGAPSVMERAQLGLFATP
jgi:DNA repair photolyase